jgi:hypothetical protein
MFIFLSCSKNKEAQPAAEQAVYKAAYVNSVFRVAKGAGFTGTSLQHDFPSGVRFYIKDVRNAAGKTVSDFLNTYKVGVWKQVLNKAVDLTESAVTAKYNLTDQVGVTIDASTGIITIAAKATQNIIAGTYSIDVEAVTGSRTVLLSKIASIELVDGTVPVKGSWKYASETSNSAASVAVTKLEGSALSEAAAKISGYSTSKTYVRLKIADARNKGIEILKDISWQSNFSLSSVNPWVTATATDDGVLLTSPIDRFPVLEADSLIKGSVQAVTLVNKLVLNFEASLNIRGEGVYDVTVKMNNHPSQNVLWWPSGKTVYMPNDLKSNNFLSNDSRWSYERMDWSKNFVVFWEKGFGADPSASATKKVDIKTLLQNLERDYVYYYDTMKFVQGGNSKTDQYRTMVMLNEQTDWLATGSGYDNQTGAIWINYDAANSAATMAHEIGHTFQYLNNCDGKYAFTGNYNYIGQIWEQTAQYQATLLYPSAYFSYIPDYIKNSHLNLLHETNRYSNFYHLQNWHRMHGVEFAGKLWQQAVAGEDAVEAYKRITSISQATFNDEIYDYARRTLNWDFLHKSTYTNYVLSTSALYTQDSKVNLLADGYYRIDTSKCVQNYGFNALQLTVPAAGTVVNADFQGLKAVSGYNNTYDQYAGWRWGWVAVTSSGAAVYSEMSSTATGNVQFTIPANTSRLYFVVTGAPTQHFHHVWDDNPANDEQYPWKAKFQNTQPKS